MPFTIPTLPEIASRSETDMASRLGTGTPLRRSFIQIIARVIAGAVNQLFGYLGFISNQVFPDTAEKEYLERWAAIWGVTRVAATFAEGNVTFTGTNTTIIPISTVLIAADGTEYTTDAEGTISAGVATVAVTCSTAGAIGNAAAAVTVSLLSPIGGIDSTVTVAAGGLINGADEQDDAGLLDAVLRRIQKPPHGGNADDYIGWALEISGVTRAWCTPLKYGAGTVGVTFVRDDDVSIIPSGGEVTEAQDYIDSVRPVTADVTVYAPTALSVPINISLSPNSAAVQAAVTAELTDLFAREAEPGVLLLLSHIRSAVSSAEGETDSVITSPVANISPTTDQIPVLGTITFTTL